MAYNYDGNYYICRNGKRLYISNILTRKLKIVYKSRKTMYSCHECTNYMFKAVV